MAVSCVRTGPISKRRARRFESGGRLVTPSDKAGEAIYVLGTRLCDQPRPTTSPLTSVERTENASPNAVIEPSLLASQ